MRKAIVLFAYCFYVGGCHSYGQNVGIGTTAPGSGFELKGLGLASQQRITDQASGNSLVLQGGTGANLKVTGYNYGTGTAQPLYLSVDGANTIINPGGGFVGIGTTSPGTTLTVNAAQYGIEHTDGVRSFSTFLNTTGVWIGSKSNHPLLFYTNDGSQQMTLAPSGQLSIVGNVTQSLGSNGLPKAMVYLNSNGTINRCFNGLTGASTSGCGFSSVHVGSGDYQVTFPFDISSRFFSVSAELGCCSSPVSVSYKVFSPNVLNIGTLTKQNGVINFISSDLPIMVIVY